MIAVIGSPFWALPMAAASRRDNPPTHWTPTLVRAVDLSSVAPAAHTEKLATRATNCQSVIVQAPAPNDNFLALVGELRDGRPSLRARATMKAERYELSAFCISPSATGAATRSAAQRQLFGEYQVKFLRI